MFGGESLFSSPSTFQYKNSFSKCSVHLFFCISFANSVLFIISVFAPSLAFLITIINFQDLDFISSFRLRKKLKILVYPDDCIRNIFILFLIATFICISVYHPSSFMAVSTPLSQPICVYQRTSEWSGTWDFSLILIACSCTSLKISAHGERKLRVIGIRCHTAISMSASLSPSMTFVAAFFSSRFFSPYFLRFLFPLNWFFLPETTFKLENIKWAYFINFGSLLFHLYFFISFSSHNSHLFPADIAWQISLLYNTKSPNLWAAYAWPCPSWSFSNSWCYYFIPISFRGVWFGDESQMFQACSSCSWRRWQK